MLIKLGSNHKAILKCLISDELDRVKPKAKNNRLYKRDYDLLKSLYERLIGKRKICKTCGQEVKNG
jgi:hypothetical protein